MWALLAKTVLPSIFKTVDKVIKGKDEAEKLKQEVQLALMAIVNKLTLSYYLKDIRH